MNRFKISTIFLFFVCVSLQAQSPWVAEHGKGFGQVSYQLIPGTANFFDREGNIYDFTEERTEQSIQAYGEYGLGENFQFSGNIAVMRLDWDCNTPNCRPENETRLNGGSLAARYQLPAKIPIAIQSKVTFPGAYTVDAMTLTNTLSIGGSKGRFYGFVYAGHGLRNNGIKDLVVVGGEAGIKIKRAYLTLYSDTQLVPGLNAADKAQPIFRANIVTDGTQQYASIGLKSLIELKNNMGLSISAAGVAWATSLQAAPYLSVGFFKKW